ncbi:MAG: hypothetical protein QM742_12605 [Aquabacterium sp.]
MSASTSLLNADCSSLPTGDRCEAALPDNPQCTLNYHFGQLLGVEDFRAEQGFHLGRSRRHQRLLHGHGVVAGYPVSYKAKDTELRVGSGYAVDALGRDLVLEEDQCVNLAKWWAARVAAKELDFSDLIGKTEFTTDLDLIVCYATCLSSPVPAIAEPCAGQASDLAYSRVCETVKLQLVRRLRVLPDVVRPIDEGRIRPGREPLDTGTNTSAANTVRSASAAASNSATITALRDRIQGFKNLPEQRDALIDLLARLDIAPPDPEDPQDLCLTLARLEGVHIKKDGQTWQVDIANINLHVRETLLSTAALQSLLMPSLDTPAPEAGPQPLAGKATAAADVVTIAFDQKLAKASVLGNVFGITQFDATTGWSVFTVTDASYAEAAGQPPTVTLKLDRALAAGQLVRIAIHGDGATPLLGDNLLPAGATRADREGRALTLTLQ